MAKIESLKILSTPRGEVRTDGDKVWVNLRNGVCVGRFTPQGVEIGAAEGGDTLLSLASKPTFVEWTSFRGWLRSLHGVAIPEGYTPKWLKIYH